MRNSKLILNTAIKMHMKQLVSKVLKKVLIMMKKALNALKKALKALKTQLKVRPRQLPKVLASKKV